MRDRSRDDGFKPGDNWVIDDRTGERIRASEARKEWTGAIVDEDDWEPRHPQDFVRGRRDNQRVSDPRPDSIPVFYGYLTAEITADAAAGATRLTVDESARFHPGDVIGVYVGGDLKRLTVLAIVDEFTISLTDPIHGTVASATTVINYSAVAPPNLG